MTEPTPEKPNLGAGLREMGRNIAGLLALMVTSVPVLWLAFWLSSPGIPDFGTDLPFAEALAQEFPPGSPLQRFGMAIEAEGFGDIQVTPDGRAGRAVLNRLLLFCKDTYSVTWTASAEGTLVAVVGEELLEC